MARSCTYAIDAIDEAVVDSGNVTAFIERFEGGAVASATVSFGGQNAADGDEVTVASAYLPQGGYVAVHDTSLPSGNVAGSVIGVSDYLEASTHTGVEIELFDVPGQEFAADTTLPGTQAVIAMPHEETNSNMAYNFIASGGDADGPFFNEDDAEMRAVIDDGAITISDGDESALRASWRQALPDGLVRSPEAPLSDVNGNEGSVWAALPYTMYVDDDGDADLFGALGGRHSIKVVVIPSGSGSGDGNGSSLKMDYETYAQAAHALGLPLD